MILPILLPMAHSRNELRFGQPRTGRLHHSLLALPLEVRRRPRRPPSTQILLHDAVDRHILRVLDALLLLALELLLHHALALGLQTPPLNHRLARLRKLLLQLPDLLPHAALNRQARNGSLLRLPRVLPRAHELDELRAR